MISSCSIDGDGDSENDNDTYVCLLFSHVENFWSITSPNDIYVQNIVSIVDILPVQKHKNN